MATYTKVDKEIATYSKVNKETPIIDMGNPPIDQISNSDGYVTYIDRINPANVSGKITSVEIYANTNMAGVEVAIFYVVSGNNLSTRSNVTIGNVVAGSKQTFSVSLDVRAGDYIGLYWSTGKLEVNDEDSNEGIWYLNSDQIPCTNVDFGTPYTWYMISLHGTGESYTKVGKEIGVCTKVDKEKSTYTKIDKGVSSYTKVDK